MFMALDGIILNNINHYLQPLLPTRINKIAQISHNEIVFQCFSHQKIDLLISCDSISNRLMVTHRDFKRVDEPNHFIMLLRKHCENGIIQSSKQVGLDRIIEWTITNRNDLGDVVTFKIMIELMGKYANVILVNDENKIVDAFHRIPPYENSKRIIFSGANYTLPEIPDRKNPFNESEVNPNIDLSKQFHGISPLLQREIDFRMEHGESFSDIMSLLYNQTTLYQSHDQFHNIPLTHLGNTYEAMDLMEGLDKVYEDQVARSRLQQHTGDLLKRVKRELKRLQNKLPKLSKQYYDATDYEIYKLKGDLLLTYGQGIKSGQQSVTLTDFNGEPIIVELDERFNGIGNAKKYFQRYHKLKTGLKYIQEQIELTEREIEYLEGILVQIEQGSIDEAIEIRKELINHGLIRENKKPSKKPPKQQKPRLKSFDIDGVTITYGLNNIQNDYLTFKKAEKNQLWFHIKDGAGSHVVADARELSERQLRFAANLAAYYSKFRHSSSVAVNYTLVKELKKIPKAPLGMVSLGSHQTIYIDPIPPEDLV